MMLDLDPATEQLLQQELATGRYPEPSAFIAHALDLVKAERADLATRRAEIIAEIEESIAQLDRGEFVTEEHLRARFAARRAARAKSQAA
jgi:Arc/MetJ-type ribon-helix-helix transcriptional regulator